MKGKTQPGKPQPPKGPPAKKGQPGKPKEPFDPNTIITKNALEIIRQTLGGKCHGSITKEALLFKNETWTLLNFW